VSTPRRIAIACQGGGSHTAFTAGVLRGLLGPGALGDRRIVGLSGTSGGAVCALVVWYALRDDDPARACALLDDFWTANAASSPPERIANAWTLWAAAMQGVGLLPAVSPYDVPVAQAASDTLRRLLERSVDFAAIDRDPGGRHPLLLLGAVDVRTGVFRAFHSHRDRITADMVLASAAIPTLFRSVPVDGGLYWDGLFSQNPPVRELLDAEPDELWVVQINPLEQEREPRSVLEIADRRNELAGNLSLHQELGFIEKIDQLLADGALDPAAGYRQVVVRVIELPRAALRGLGAVSKLDRDPAFLTALVEHGERQAAEFLAALRFERALADGDADAAAAMVAPGARVVTAAPLEPGEHRGEALRDFLGALADGAARVDPTRKQVAGDRVSWSLRVRGGNGQRAVAEAEFRDGLVRSLRVAGAS
jgi:NTE family protein